MANGLFWFDDYTPPCPSEYTGTTSTVVDSGRNVKGYVVGGVVREDISAIDMTFNYISTAEWSKLLKQFDSKYGGSFYRKVHFYDQVSDTYKYRTFYVGDRTTSGLHALDRNGKPQGWIGARLSLVEK